MFYVERSLGFEELNINQTKPMTVKQAIDELSKLPPEAVLAVQGRDRLENIVRFMVVFSDETRTVVEAQTIYTV